MSAACLDVWSLGCILVELATREKLFQMQSWRAFGQLMLQKFGQPSEELLNTWQLNRDDSSWLLQMLKAASPDLPEHSHVT